MDLTHQQVRRDDVLILCSDGLSGQVKIDEIARVVTEQHDLMMVCKSLIDLANENGGPDNITVIAARFAGTGLTAPASGDNVGHRTFPLPTDSGQTPAASRTTAAVSDSITRETPAPVAEARRTTLKLPSLEIPFIAEPPRVLSSRRTRGSLIALALLIIFFAFATWWGYRTAVSVVAPKQRGAPAPATRTP